VVDVLAALSLRHRGIRLDIPPLVPRRAVEESHAQPAYAGGPQSRQCGRSRSTGRDLDRARPIADALAGVARYDEAIEAYERYLRINTSSVEGYCKLAAAHARSKDPQAAQRARREALDTYRALPRYQRRKQLVWWLRARLGL
jgi:tetratricopeptide (TPR) repeat protein